MSCNSRMILLIILLSLYEKFLSDLSTGQPFNDLNYQVYERYLDPQADDEFN